MVMKKNIVHSYYKKEIDKHKILVQVNPETFQGVELIIHPDGKVEKTKIKYDEEIYEDLKVDDFKESSALEFNLYLKGVKGQD